jgi:hypothetical protein
MAQTRFTCTLTRADEPACQSCTRVTIMDSEGASARACPRRARRHHRRSRGLGRLQGPQRGGRKPLSWPKSKASSGSQSAQDYSRPLNA